MRKLLAILTMLSVIVVAAAGCSGKKAAETQEKGQAALIKTAIMLDWTPNTNHTGLYVALDKGFFHQQGLDVQILQSGDPGPAQLVAAGKVDFGVSYQEEVTNARAADIPIVSLAAVIQHNTSGFASLKKDGITGPKDLEGKRYGGWGSPAEHAVIEAVMKKGGADPAKVQMIDIGAADFFSVIGKEVDFTWIFYGWDGIQAELKGIPLNIMMLREFDPALDYYTPLIIASEKTIAERPELAKKFIAAASQGYVWATEHPDEAAEILLKHAPELDAQLVKASQKWLSGQYKADASRRGWQEQGVWERYGAWMLEQKLLDKPIDASRAFTNEFLPQ